MHMDLIYVTTSDLFIIVFKPLGWYFGREQTRKVNSSLVATQLLRVTGEKVRTVQMWNWDFPEETWEIGASGYHQGNGLLWGPNLELLEPHRPEFEFCLHYLLYNFSKALKFLCLFSDF